MSRTSEIKKFRSEIEGLEDHNLAEGLYDKIVEFENGTEEDKRKLHILLSTKVQELKQAEHDEKSEAGDKKGAAEAIKPEAEKDRDSDPKAKKSQKKLQTAEERAKNPEKDRYGVIKPIHVPGKSAKNPNGCELKLVSNKELKALQDEDIEAKPEKRRIVGVRPVKPLSRDLPITQYQAILRKLALVMALLVGFAPSVMGALASDDIATMAAFNQTDGWKVNADGDLVPITTNNNAIGTTSLYPSQICLNALCKTSWGDVVSPMTDAEGYTYPTDSGAVVRLYDAGYINLGAGTAVDQYILMDGDTDDWYAGVDDTDNDYTIGAGSTLGADQRIRVTDDLNNTIVTIGDNTNAYDHYLVFDGNETDMSFGYLDTYDMLVAFYGSTVDANLAFGVENSTSPLLVVWNGIDGYGAVDIDYGSADITDHSFVSDGGTTILDGGITIGDNGELITNATDDTIRIASDDADTILEVYTAFDTTGDATLKLSADLGDAVKEQWTLTSTGATNDLVFGCDTGSSGTPVTQLTLADGGVLTTIAAINSEIDDASNTSVTDVLNLQHFTSGTAAAGIGTGLTFDLENAAGTEEEHLYLDAVATVSTDASESTDLVIGQMTAGALAETLRLVGLQSATAGTSVTITSNTTETNGITDILSLANVTGTATHNAGLGITWDFEDAGGAEEQASLDVQLIVATDGQEDADIIFSQQTDGAIAETMRIVGQAEATTGDYVLISQNTQETDAVLDALVLKGVTSGTATTGMGIGISFQPEDAGGAEEQGSIDVALTDATDTSEDADFVFKQNTDGAVAETLRLVAAAEATTGDYLQFTSNTQETNGLHNVLVLKTATGTATDNYGMSISFQPEDATGAEEHASIDIVQTTAARATNDTDFVFTQDINGTMTETVRFDADASLGGAVVIEGASPLAFGGATDDAYFTIVAVGDAASSSKTVTLPSVTGAFSLETTATTALTANTTATITVVPGTDKLYTYTIDTDNEDCTLTFSAGGTANDRITIIFITDAAGSADEVMTFHGTLSDSAGTLTLANGASKRYVIEFVSDGTIWNEVSRTAVLG